jgi:hypothetical protein
LNVPKDASGALFDTKPKLFRARMPFKSVLELVDIASKTCFNKPKL